MLAQVQIVAAEEGGEGIDLLIPNTAELISGILAFTVVFLFMWRFAWPQLKQLLDERQKAIAGQIQDAEAIKVEAQSLLNDYKSQIANAKDEGNSIVEEARVQAETVRAGIVDKANTEAAEIVGKAREEASLQKDRAMTEARQEVANLSIDLAEKVVGDSLDREAQQGLVDRYLADLERMSE